MNFLYLRSYLFLLIIPIFYCVMSLVLRAASGPFWQFCDPSYQYLFNAVYMVKGGAPNVIEHPGTPLQLLMLLIIRIFNIGHSNVDTVKEVLLNPEFYLYITFTTLLILTLLTGFLSSLFVYKKTKDKLAAILFQLPSLTLLTLPSLNSSFTVLPVVANVSPEPLLIIIINLFNLCLLNLFFAKTPKQNLLAVLWLGLVCGLGIATKFVFLPLFLAAFLIVSWRMKPLLLFICIFSFVLWTFPIIHKYFFLVNWLKDLLTHSGAYGQGEENVINWPIFCRHLKEILSIYWVYSLLTFGLLIWNLLLLKKNWRNRNALFFVALTFMCLTEYLMTAKHFSLHYLLPTICLFSSIFVLYYINHLAHNVFLKRITLIFILCFSIQAASETIAYQGKMKELTLDLKNLRDKIQTNYPNCNLIPSTNVGTNLYMTQMHGLFYGNYGSSHIVDEELSRLYPNQLYFDPEGKETSDREDGFGIRDFFGKRVFADNLLSPGTCNIVIKPICDISNLPYVFKTVEKSKYAAANLLVGSTEKLAEDYYRASMIALENEKAKDAIIFSYRAKELNYQPQNKVDFIIAMLYKQLHPNQSK